jgi:superfamily II DNA or RNA helicase
MLGDNMDVIKSSVERETGEEYVYGSQDWKRECGRRIGVFGEYVALLGFLLKVPHLTNIYGSTYQLNKWDNKNGIPSPVKSICSISAGSKESGEIDILVIDETVHRLWCFSSKFRKMYDSGNLKWGDTEVDRMKIVESRNNKCFDKFVEGDSWNYGVFVFNRHDFKNECQKYKDVVVYDWQDIKIIWQQVYTILAENSFDSHKVDQLIDIGREHLVPRFHQIAAANAAMNYWGKNEGKFFLFDHISRSGKTITALNTCKKMGFKNVLLVTSFPCINEMEWGDTIGQFHDFEYWNVVNYSGKTGLFDDTKQNFVMISLQDLKSNDRSNLTYGMGKEKFDAIRDVYWDCVIVDEVHYGYETDKSQDIVGDLGFDYCLALSATPFVNYFRNTFDFSNTHRWSIFDECERAKIDPVYAAYPKMHFLLFAPPVGVYTDYLQEYAEEDGLTFNKLLRVKDDGTFFYEKDVDSIIKFVFGETGSGYNSRNTPFGWVRENGLDKGRGILIFVPECDRCKPLRDRLLQNDKVKAMFGNNIHYTYSDLNKSNELKGWLKKNANPPFIIIAVGQLTTGVTVKGVDTVIMMDDGNSPQQLMQRMFRCRTAAEGKKDAFVIDLNPARTFKMVYDYASTLAHTDSVSQMEYFKKFFALMPIVYCKDNRMIDCSKDLNKIFNDAAYSHYNCFGKKSLILDIPDDLKAELAKLAKTIMIGGKSSKKSEKYIDGIEKGKSFVKEGDGNNKHSEDDDHNEEVEDDENIELLSQKMFLNILQSICWASALCGCKFDRYEEIFEYLDEHPDLKREYDKLLFD